MDNIIASIVDAYAIIMNTLSEYPIAQGAVATTLGIAVSAGVGIILWKGPVYIYNLFKRQFVTTLRFNSHGTGWSDAQQVQFNALLNWYSKTWWFKLSRVITLNMIRSSEYVIGPGAGNHFFMFKGRLFIMSIEELSVHGDVRSKYVVNVHMLGRSHKVINALMDSFLVVKKNQYKTIDAYISSSSTDWEYGGEIKERSIDTIILPEEVYNKIFQKSIEFVKNADWYYKRGISYKLTYLLYGEPGTGKSSIAKTLASYLKRDLYIVSSNTSPNILIKLFQKASGGIVLIEDIDAFGYTKSRSGEENNIKNESNVPGIKYSDDKKSSNGEQMNNTHKSDNVQNKFQSVLDDINDSVLSGLLNALHGVVDMDDVIIIMSTNHPEKLDPALIRDGRVDERVHIPRLSDAEIKRYIKLFFPDYIIDNNEVFEPLPGATVQKAFLNNKNSVDDFIKSLKSIKPITKEYM